jgi:hypothetical protein
MRAGDVVQQGLMPTHQDPKLWLVETRTGQEREACIRMMQKTIDLQTLGTPLAIKSCFVQDHLQVQIPRTSGCGCTSRPSRHDCSSLHYGSYTEGGMSTRHPVD